MKKIKPTKNNVFIKIIVEDKIGDIHIPEESRKAGMRGEVSGEVLAIGPEVRDIRVGERALLYKHLFTSYDAQKFKMEEEENAWGLLLHETDVLAIMC